MNLMFLVAIGAVILFVGVYFAVVRGSLGLLSKRLDEDPELRTSIDDEQLDKLDTLDEY